MFLFFQKYGIQADLRSSSFFIPAHARLNIFRALVAADPSGLAVKQAPNADGVRNETLSRASRR
jgi:hypothetical protein